MTRPALVRIESNLPPGAFPGPEDAREGCPMSEFHQEITRRAIRANEILRSARNSGDDYLVSVQEAELENLARLAREHGLRIPQLAGFSAA